MINWDLKNSKESRSNWFFPNFEIQEYLLPIIYVGGQFIDEYDDAKYEIEDCRRLRQSILYYTDLLDTTDKEVIRYDTMHKGLVSLDKSLIEETLKALDTAAAEAIENRQNLMFYGD
jgi:hypothetical protein